LQEHSSRQLAHLAAAARSRASASGSFWRLIGVYSALRTSTPCQGRPERSAVLAACGAAPRRCLGGARAASLSGNQVHTAHLRREQAHAERVHSSLRSCREKVPRLSPWRRSRLVISFADCWFPFFLVFWSGLLLGSATRPSRRPQITSHPASPKAHSKSLAAKPCGARRARDRSSAGRTSLSGGGGRPARLFRGATTACMHSCTCPRTLPRQVSGNASPSSTTLAGEAIINITHDCNTPALYVGYCSCCLSDGTLTHGSCTQQGRAATNYWIIPGSLAALLGKRTSSLAAESAVQPAHKVI
jgi:hypothetical protein